MSKKDKSKFRKRIKAQILREMAQMQSGQKPVSTSQPTPIAPNAVPTAVVAETPATVKTLDYTKQDLKKSAIIISSIIVLIIALYLTDARTNLILKISGQIFKALRISL